MVGVISQTQYGKKEGLVPEVDLKPARLQDLILSEIGGGRVESAHDLAEGGLLVALVEMLRSSLRS